MALKLAVDLRIVSFRHSPLGAYSNSKAGAKKVRKKFCSNEETELSSTRIEKSESM